MSKLGKPVSSVTSRLKNFLLNLKAESYPPADKAKLINEKDSLSSRV